jgi:hypothetical protein
VDICGNFYGKISAINLKEIVVKFNKEVDQKTAENKDNYVTTPSIEDATLMEDGRTVVLTVDKMTNQAKYYLTIKNIKDGDKVFVAKDIAFSPLDVTLPEVEKVEALGNKAVILTFSEPMKKDNASISNFAIDGKAIAGTVVADGGRTMIVKTYTTLADGKHVIKYSKLTDYVPYTIITGEKEFVVTEDKVAPVIESVNSTFEYVTVKFSEPVQNVRGGSYAYWKTSPTAATKYYSDASVVKIDDSTYRFYFSSANKLPGYKVFFYVEGVKDYSDNIIAKDTPVEVIAIVDQTRPEVKSVELNEDTYKTITVKYTKSIKNIDDRTKYSLKDADSKNVSIKSINKDTSNTTATIELYSALDEGNYKFSIEGLKDNTTLENVMLPYTTTFEVGDTTAPTVKSIVKDGRYIIIQFTEEMSLDGDGSIAKLENYIIKYNGVTRALPTGTSLEVLNGAKGVMLIMPEKINNVAYDVTKLTAVTVQRVEDKAGNILDDYSQSIADTALDSKFEIATSVALSGKNVVLTDSRTITVVFNQNIGTDLDKDDFVLSGTLPSGIAIESVQVDGNKVTLTLNKDIYDNNAKLNVVAGGFKSIIGTEVAAETSAVKVFDKVKPTLAAASPIVVGTGDKRNEITLAFNEKITSDNANLMAHDLIVMRVDGEKVLEADVDYKTTVSADGKLVITLQNDKTAIKGHDSLYSVQLKAEPTFIKDLDGNKAEAFGPIVTPTNIDYEAPSAVEGSFKVVNATTITVVFNEKLDASKFTADNANGFAVAGGTSVPTITKAELGTDGVTVTITGTNFVAGTTTVAYNTTGNLTDLAGNSLANITATATK